MLLYLFSVSSTILATFVLLGQGKDGGRKVSRFLDFEIVHDPLTLVSTLSIGVKNNLTIDRGEGGRDIREKGFQELL